MSRVIVIQLSPQVLRAIVASGSGETLQVEAVVSVPVEASDLKTAELQLASALESHHPQKAKVLVAVPSASIKWQHLSLPPCPPEDLPALVKMQLEIETARDDEEVGYDFLSFAGDEQKPQRILAGILKVADLARVRNFYRLVGLKVDGIVPVAMGWPALAEMIDQSDMGTRVCVALHEKEATISGVDDGESVLFRQLQLAEDWTGENLGTSLAAQLRRTLLSLSQEGIATETAKIVLLGEPISALERVAISLREQLSQPIELLMIPSEVGIPDSAKSQRAELLPLVGLAWQASQGKAPHIDFLHPKKPTPPQSNRRSLALAGVAGTLLAIIVGWQGYAMLNQPLWTAEALQAELDTIKKELEPLEAEERDARRISDWLDASPNLLTELAAIGQDWRPEPFESPEFSFETDGVLKRFELNNRQLSLTGNVTSIAAVQPLENRLRDNGHRVRRERSEPLKEGGQYPWQVQIVVDITDPAAAAEEQP
jgi:hypothetical protein